MPLNVPTIVKTSETLLVTFEEAVASFPRYHKYAIGAELREQARAIARAARRAWSDRERRCKRIEELEAGSWTPARPTCFVAKLPKAREIHAPDFRDRVVHHWLVPQLEQIYEPIFIYDSFSNRRGD